MPVLGWKVRFRNESLRKNIRFIGTVIAIAKDSHMLTVKPEPGINICDEGVGVDVSVVAGHSSELSVGCKTCCQL